MAGEWIKLEMTTLDKPEVLRIARMLKIDRDAALGKLVRLWSWFDANSVDGVVDGVVDSDVDRMCFCNGFAAACAAVGWLVVDEAAERITLPNFDRHNGETAKQRALKNRRQANWRAGKDATVDTTPSTKTSTRPSTTASTREEKRREDKEEDQKPLSSAEPKTDLLGPKPPLADLTVRRAERLAAVTEDAITAYNRILGKPAGNLSAVNPKVGRKKRQDQVRRMIQVSAEICDDQFGDKKIVPEFWESYFGACDADPFMRGDGPYTGGHANWRPDFEYLTRPDTVLKVFERATQEDAA